ncbi:hypothetical protein BV394_01885 [Brevirhabdus pacifica]|uniref:Uncharacterized protein n=1 Tax=Brevirhabdus pacifica TaxID=1267768 RepID=A0A1U7DF96_9RHOB|nr:hypothetical protein [Brevirhabdus pacifica]APX88631.1 hypothetical protein BV394_01885 [Brevirhabdus pacifica]OWU79907.1 hypothetical protein ATO5_02575 [Loktanella sp. 22II-4b]
MPEPLQEVSTAFHIFRRDLAGRLSALRWLICGLTGCAAVAVFLILGKVDQLETAAARSTAILERVEAQINRIAAR